MSLQTKTFAAQDALVADLAAHGDLSGWKVEYGLPAKREELHVWVDDQVADWTQSPPTTGILTQDEEFTLSVYVYVRRTGASALEVRQEVLTAAGAVAAVMGQQPFLGGILRFAHISGAEYDSAFADAKGNSREGALKINVACEAFLTSA